MSYFPRPIPTEHVHLSTALQGLIDRLGENAHEIWAARRIAEGWKYGPKKDGDKKETPLLVPYSELPDSEKQYDLDMVTETIKALLALGFQVVKPE